MKRPVPTTTRARHAVRRLVHAPARPAKLDKIGRADGARKAAVGTGTQAASAVRVHDQAPDQAGVAAMAIGKSIGQRPIFAVLVTGAIGLMLGLLRPRG